MEKDWVKVETYTDDIKAEISRQMLLENGINAVLLNKKDSSLMFGKIELYVSSSSQEEAVALLVENVENEGE